jgi:ATP-dependent RNA helicase DeaD
MLPPDFESLGISASVLKAVKQLGYEQPSPIQAQSIPILLNGENLLGVAQTGTGKTGAFALPLLSRLDVAQKTPQILVLTPTRELAIQVAEAFQTYARNLKNFHVLPIYGGQDMSVQLRGLRRGAQVIVGTPGRILDHIRRRSLILNQLNALVLDEADEMLRMGFIADVETILAETPDTCQRALFSATMPPAIRRVVKKYLGDAKEVSIASKTKTVERITQFYLIVKGHQKMEALTRILEVEEFDGMLIFVRTKSATSEVAEKLEARGFSAAPLNGDLSQTLRERTVNRLKKGQVDIVVATDVAARGLDVERISHVINYDIPYDNEAYVHRIGRTGRAGREGKAILFVAPKENRLLHSIEKSTKQKITLMGLPTGDQVSGQRIQQFQERALESLQIKDLERFKELLQKMCEDNSISMSDIAASLASQLQQERPLFPNLQPIESKFNESQSSKNSGNSRPDRPKRRTETDRNRSSSPDAGMVTYRMEAGKSHGVMPGDIVGAIASESGIDGKSIGRIRLFDDYSTVDLPEGMPSDIFQHLKHKVRVKQQPMKLSLLNEDAPKKDFSEKRKPKRSPINSANKKT